jgi:hypothetical protein
VRVKAQTGGPLWQLCQQTMHCHAKRTLLISSDGGPVSLPPAAAAAESCLASSGWPWQPRELCLMHVALNLLVVASQQNLGADRFLPKLVGPDTGSAIGVLRAQAANIAPCWWPCTLTRRVMPPLIALCIQLCQILGHSQLQHIKSTASFCKLTQWEPAQQPPVI